MEGDKEDMETAARKPRKRWRSRSSLKEATPGKISFTRKEASNDEPPAKWRQGGIESDQCALALLAAAEALEKMTSSSMMSSSKETCEPHHKRCFNNDQCILAFVSASAALKVALTELKTSQSFRLEFCFIDEPRTFVQNLQNSPNS